MDPYSRRFLWNLILDLVRDGRSVVLTSHRYDNTFHVDLFLFLQLLIELSLDI